MVVCIAWPCILYGVFQSLRLLDICIEIELLAVFQLFEALMFYFLDEFSIVKMIDNKLDPPFQSGAESVSV